MGCLMLSGGREDPPYPRPSEPMLREEPFEPRFSAPPVGVRPAASPLPDSAEERGDIGENFCQPPPLLLPPSRAAVELPGLAAEPAFELPRDSALLSELWFARWNPLFEPLFPIDLPFDAVVAPRVEKKC